MKKKLRPKLDVWTYLGSKVKIRLDHTIWGSFESSWALENGKNNEKNFCDQKWTFGHIWGKSRLNHTLWGSFESSLAPENGKNVNQNCVQKWRLSIMWLKLEKSP